jgi:hypothetical protein
MLLIPLSPPFEGLMSKVFKGVGGWEPMLGIKDNFSNTLPAEGEEY